MILTVDIKIIKSKFNFTKDRELTNMIINYCVGITLKRLGLYKYNNILYTVVTDNTRHLIQEVSDYLITKFTPLVNKYHIVNISKFEILTDAAIIHFNKELIWQPGMMVDTIV